MTKLIIILVSMMGLAAAGVLDTKWWINGPSNRIYENLQGTPLHGNDGDPILRMSFDELMREKFLLLILDHVDQPVVDEDLCQGSNTFVMDQNKYKEGIDSDMANVMQLFQDFRLLGKNEVFTISNKDHMHQMIGLHRIFVSSKNWETFTTNVCVARKTLNGVLFVNALLLALRERNDTRSLIIPGIHEILPEMYLNKDIIRAARNVDVNSLTSTVRPNFFDMFGLEGRNNLVNTLNNRKQGMLSKSQNPWRVMHMQMAMQNIQNRKGLFTPEVNGKTVLPVQKFIDSTANVNLLTDDVGLKGFLHLMINDLCLRESELKNMRKGRVGLNGDIGITMIGGERLINNNENSNFNNWNVDTDQFFRPNRVFDANQGIAKQSVKDGRRFEDWNNSDRSIGRQRKTLFSSPNVENEKFLLLNPEKLSTNNPHFQNDDVKWPTNFQDRLINVIYGIRPTNKNPSSGSQSNRKVNKSFWQDSFDRVQFNNDNSDLPTTSIDDERLLHVSRRRLSPMDKNYMGQQQTGQDAFINIMHKPRVNDGHHTVEQNNGKLSTLRNNNNLNWQTAQGRMTTNWDENMDEQGIVRNRNDLNQRISGGIRNKNLDNAIFRMMAEKNQQDDLPITDFNDERILYINPHRNEQDDDMNNNDMMRGNRFADVSHMRRVMGDDMLSQRQNEMSFNDEDFIGLQGNAENRRFMNFNHQQKTDDDSNILRRRTRDTRSIPRSNMLLNNNKIGSDVLLHNINQILARIQINQISLGWENQILSENELRNLHSKQSSGINPFTTDGRISIELLRDIENTIQILFENVNIGRDVSDPISFDNKIANIVLSQEGNVNVLNIIRGIVANKKLLSNDIQSLNDLGIDLKNPLLHIILQRLNEAIVMYRTEILGSYTKEDLGLDGVSVNDVFVDQLKTSTDSNDIDILNLLGNRNVLSSGGLKTVVARQQRLNHKDFTIKIDLDSNRDRRVVIRTMLGPKLTDQMGRELPLEQRRQNFILLDTNIVDLQMGKNLIKRKSQDITWTARDTTPLTQIYKHVIMTLDSQMNLTDVVPLKNVIGQDCRFPHRLLLPRGRVDGLEMQLLVIVSPLENGVVLRDDTACAMGVGISSSDYRSLGFPLDRRIDNIGDWVSLPNLKVTDVVIKHDGKMNL